MKRPPPALALLVLGLALPLTTSLSAAAAPAAATPLPVFLSRPGVPFAPADTRALTAWALEQPAVVTALGGHRTRVLRSGSDVRKDEHGADVWLGAIFVRDYDEGVTYALQVNLKTGAITIDKSEALVQPSGEEIAEALAIMGRDPELASLIASPKTFIPGGFFMRTLVADDPCAHDVCVTMHMRLPGPGRRGILRRVVVNLSRGTIASRWWSNWAPPGDPRPMTDGVAH